MAHSPHFNIRPTGICLRGIVTDATREHERQAAILTRQPRNWREIVAKRIVSWERIPGRPTVTPTNWFAIY